MALEELKKDLIDANADIKSYLEYSEEYLKLRVFKLFMVSLTTFAHILLVGSIGLLALFFLSIAVSMYIGSTLDSTFQGFLIVGIVYVAFGIMGYFLRHKLDGPILHMFSKHFFSKEP